MNAPGYSPIAPLFRVCDGARIRFADNKADSSAVTVLMLSPWPESLWAFRRIWDRVSGAARVVAIDLPGFGHSDGRPELIAPDAMGTFLARLIEQWGLGAPHVVGPDVGTDDPRDSRGSSGLDPADVRCLLALLHARLVMRWLPSVPPEHAHFTPEAPFSPGF